MFICCLQPDVLKTAYSFEYMTTATAGNSMSVAEFQYQYCKYLYISSIYGGIIDIKICHTCCIMYIVLCSIYTFL